MNDTTTKARKADYEITACDTPIDFDDKSRYKKVDADDPTMAAFFHSIPTMLAADTMAKAYLVKFPEGLPHTLLKLNRGGYSSTIVDANGNFLDTASLYELTNMRQLYSAFSLMSFVTCQYFLTQIFDQLSVIRGVVDDVMEFLYGDKRAELISELNFVNYASSVYSSVMTSDPQRIATITNLQQAKQVAIKDIEFYINDLEKKAKGSIKDYAAFTNIAEKAIEIKKCLEAAMQLYVSSTILEAYYANNWDAAYVAYVENDVSFFLSKCDKRMLQYFTALEQRCKSLKSPLLGKDVKVSLEKELSKIVTDLADPQKSELLQKTHEALHLPQEKTEFYVTKDGNVYQTA